MKFQKLIASTTWLEQALGGKIEGIKALMQKPEGKKLAAFRSKNAAKYHLQTAITPFAKLTYFYQGVSAISI